MSGDQLIGLLNPIRYRGYYYDSETGLYYLQSRYYDPETGRFISADVYASTGQGVLGHNMYAYCLNNPVNFADPTGCACICLTQRVGPRHVCEFASEPKNAESEKPIRDVTDEVNAALMPAAQQCFYDRLLGPIKFYKFYTIVNHKEEWDIKRPDPWVETIGTPFPGEEARIVYNGEVMTPQGLGNYTYGYLGAAFGIPLPVLYAGSYYAAGLPVDYDLLSHEIGEDWNYITQGYIAAKREGIFGCC